MSKRTTEAVLRDEVARAEKDLATAKRKVELASSASDAAAARHAEQKNAADLAAGALLRARQALAAFTGSPDDRQKLPHALAVAAAEDSSS